jgi:hypothetical protein
LLLLRARCLALGRSCAGQVASFGFAAAFSGTWFALWVRLQVQMRREGFLGPFVEPEARRRRDGGMWEQLGWFSGLVCAGSVAGAVAWSAFMTGSALAYDDDPDLNARQGYAHQASSARWNAVFYILYPVEFLCVIMAKVILLGRLSNHASHNYNSQPWHRDDGVAACHCIGEYALEKLHRAISKAVALASVAGVLALVVAAAYDAKAAGVYDQAAAACDAQGNDTDSSIALANYAVTLNYGVKKVSDAVGVQAVLEAIVLVVMCAAYMVFIPVCVSMFGRAERRLIRILGQIEYKLDHSVVLLPAEYNPQATDGSAAGAEIRMRCDKGKELLRMTLAEATGQRRRFVAACAILLVTFFLRAFYDLLYASTFFASHHENPLCGPCDPCQSDRFLISMWLNYTPELQAVFVGLSSPLPLVVSLWLMMTKEDRKRLVFPAANEHAQPLLEQNMVEASRRNMSIDLLST